MWREEARPGVIYRRRGRALSWELFPFSFREFLDYKQQEYFHAVLFDLVERHDISHPKAVKDLAHRLIDNTGSLCSINRSRMLVQVCESMVEPQTRKRELAALAEAMAEYGLKFGTVVTRSEEDQIKVGAGKIEVVPAWRFLLNLPES